MLSSYHNGFLIKLMIKLEIAWNLRIPRMALLYALVKKAVKQNDQSSRNYPCSSAAC